MAEDWYTRWAVDYTTAFGLLADAELRMVLSWREAFALENYSDEELRTATRRMIAGDAPQYRSDHLRKLHEHVRRLRSERTPAVPPRPTADDARGVCVDCLGSGWAVVPHPTSMSAGEWSPPYYTLAVLCRCPLGNWKSAHQTWPEKPGPPLTLAAYESTFRDWRQWTAWKEQLHAAQAAASSEASALDAVMGRILARAREQARALPPRD